jgi:hypothetical protein
MLRAVTAKNFCIVRAIQFAEESAAEEEQKSVASLRPRKIAGCETIGYRDPGRFCLPCGIRSGVGTGVGKGFSPYIKKPK